MDCSRRKLALALPAMLAASGLRAEEKSKMPSEVYVFENLPARHYSSNMDELAGLSARISQV